MYEEYLRYVKDYLTEKERIIPPEMLYRTKYQHTVRVLGWAKRLAEGRKDIDTELLYTAVIFHDIGAIYGVKESHAARGAEIFYEYGIEKKMDLSFVEKVRDMIALHSSKELLKEKTTPLELILLMEADMLDEEGALRIAWYCVDKGINGLQSYEDVYKHVVMGNNKRLVNPMITDKAKSIWDEKKKLVEEFTKQLEDDITV